MILRTVLELMEHTYMYAIHRHYFGFVWVFGRSVGARRGLKLLGEYKILHKRYQYHFDSIADT